MQHDFLTEPRGAGAVDGNGAVEAATGAVEAAGGAGSEVSGELALALPPLTISALLVTKADLIRGLRVYLPQLADIEALDGDRFLLHVGPGGEAVAGADAPAGRGGDA